MNYKLEMTNLDHSLSGRGENWTSAITNTQFDRN